jgi:hypothetical protein
MNVICAFIAVRLLGPNPLTDYKIGTAFLFRHAGVHIMSNSWGPNDDGKSMPFSGPLTRTALKIGISKVREHLPTTSVEEALSD